MAWDYEREGIFSEDITDGAGGAGGAGHFGQTAVSCCLAILYLFAGEEDSFSEGGEVG